MWYSSLKPSISKIAVVLVAGLVVSASPVRAATVRGTILDTHGTDGQFDSQANLPAVSTDFLKTTPASGMPADPSMTSDTDDHHATTGAFEKLGIGTLISSDARITPGKLSLVACAVPARSDFSGDIAPHSSANFQEAHAPIISIASQDLNFGASENVYTASLVSPADRYSSSPDDASSTLDITPTSAAVQTMPGPAAAVFLIFGCALLIFQQKKTGNV